MDRVSDRGGQTKKKKKEKRKGQTESEKAWDRNRIGIYAYTDQDGRYRSLEMKTRHVSISNAAKLPTYLQIYLTLT